MSGTPSLEAVRRGWGWGGGTGWGVDIGGEQWPRGGQGLRVGVPSAMEAARHHVLCLRLPSSPPAPAVIPHRLPASPPSLPSGCDTGLYTSWQGQREGRAGSRHPPWQPRNLTWPGERVSTRLRPPAGWGHPRSPGPAARESRGQEVGRVTRCDRPRACGLHMAPGRQAGGRPGTQELTTGFLAGLH